MCVSSWVCNQTNNQCEPAAGAEVVCPPMSTACTENRCDEADGVCKMLPKPEGTTCDDGDACTEPDFCTPAGTCEGSPKDCSDGDDCTSNECVGGSCQNNPLSGGTTYLTADFDAGLPGGWTPSTDNGAINWAATSDENAGGGAGQAIRVTGPDLTTDHGAAEALLRLPPLLLQGSPKISFSVKADFAESTGEFNKCFADKDYVQIRVYTGSGDQYFPTWCLSNSTNGWIDVEANLIPFSTDVTIAFAFHTNDSNNDAAGVVIDNVEVRTDYECSTSAACIPGLCSAGACMEMPHECDDDDPCTTDTCDTGTGLCNFEPIPGCECTIDSDCGFSFNPCVEVVCNAGTCEENTLSGSCDDGDKCTENETCVAGECEGQLASACVDGDPCTLDECDPFGPGNGCINTSATLPCDDGDNCTFNDTCTLGGACSGQPVDCNDPGGCLTGTCTAGSCQFTEVKSEGFIVWSENFEGRRALRPAHRLDLRCRDVPVAGRVLGLRIRAVLTRDRRPQRAPSQQQRGRRADLLAAAEHPGRWGVPDLRHGARPKHRLRIAAQLRRRCVRCPGGGQHRGLLQHREPDLHRADRRLPGGHLWGPRRRDHTRMAQRHRFRGRGHHRRHAPAYPCPVR